MDWHRRGGDTGVLGGVSRTWYLFIGGGCTGGQTSGGAVPEYPLGSLPTERGSGSLELKSWRTTESAFTFK